MSDDQLQLHDLQPAPGSKKRKIRVGRGEAGRRGKTAGRGTKGQKARGTVPPWFEGGRTPLHRQVPQLKGFKNPNKVVFNPVNVGDLDRFDAGTEITPDLLRQAGLAKKKGPIKVLGNGDLDKALTVKVDAASTSARSKIEAAGGSVELIES
ncbi:MAG: 50S ribosomal protein L15 [Acidimicrobiia bacterium]